MGAGRNRDDARSADVFRAFHRDRRRSTIWRRGPLVVVLAVAFALAGWGIASAAPPGPVLVPSAVAVQSSSVPSSDGTLAGPAPAGGAQPGASPATAVLPDPAAASAPGQEAPVQEAPAPEIPPQQHFSIDVTATGHQPELDACQWVRMNVNAIAPIVGAHNFCGGDVVLAMNVGDLVSLSGGSLDGDYQITGSRDARAGDDAAQATAGLTGDLLFQTCYWNDAQGLRLVTAVRVDLSLPPVVR